jgi:hypothetical protein
MYQAILVFISVNVVQILGTVILSLTADKDLLKLLGKKN